MVRDRKCVCLFLIRNISRLKAFQVVLVVKNPPADAGDVRDEGSIPGSGRSPGILAWKPIPIFLPGESPWREEPGG